MSDQRETLKILADLGEDFVSRHRRGERPTVGDYAARHPEMEDQIRKFISALVIVENLAPVDQAAHSAPEFGGDSPAGSMPQQIGDFRIIRQVGRGGMGIVYEAEQISLGRHVALKVLPQQMLHDERQEQRFELEARSAAKLHHTNIVPVFGVGASDGLHYYVMQFIEGLGLNEVLKELQRTRKECDSEYEATSAPLRVSRRAMTVSNLADFVKQDRAEQPTQADSCRECDARRQEDVTVESAPGDCGAGGTDAARSTVQGSLSDTFTLSGSFVNPSADAGANGTAESQPRNYWQSVANMGVQVASALQYAHEQGVFHRDVKPSNLLLDTQGTVWVLDFGLAKVSDQRDLTHTGDVLGTLRYMPPEAFEGKSDARSDLYSLGLTLYELLALQPAFNETAGNRLIKQVTDQAPTRLDKLDSQIPRDLVTVVHKAIDFDPSRRYQTSKELADDLKRFLNDEPIRARRVSFVEHVHRWARRNRALSAAVGLIAVLLVTINIAGPILTVGLKRAYDAEVDARSRANQSELEAVRALDLAQRKEKEAIRSLQTARSREQALNRTLYWAEMSLAGQAASERAGIERVRNMTSAWRPAAGEEDLRDWEWYYLHGLGRLAEQTIQVDGGNAESVAWNPDGSRIAYGLDVGTIVVRNMKSAKTILRERIHNGHILHVCWSSDGTKLASIASQDEYVRVLDPATGVELWTLALPGAKDWSGSVMFSRNGQFLAADSRNEIAIWCMQTGKTLRTLKMDEGVSQVAWSPVDDRIAAASKNGRITIWDGTTGSQIATYQIGSGRIAWDPLGERLAYAGQDRRIYVMKLSTDERFGSSAEHVAEITNLAWNQMGNRIASAGKDATVRIWDPQTGNETARLRGHTGFVTSLAWSPCGSRLATTGRDHTVKIWRTDSTDEQIVLRGSEDPVNSISWGSRGRFLAAANGPRTSFWDVDQRSTVRQFSGHRVALRPIGRQIAIAGGSEIEIRDRRSGDLVITLVGHTEGITRLAWNADGSRLVSASWDGTARIWDPANGKTTTTLNLSHRDRDICWSPDGACLATIGNRDVRIWDTESGTQLRQKLSNNQLHAIAWNPDGRYIASGGWSHEITIWNALTGETVQVLTGHTSPITSLCWNPEGTRLVSGSDDRLVRIWTIESRGELLSLHGHELGVTSVGWSPDGMRIASGDRLGRVILWDAASGHLQERTPQALNIVNRRLEATPSLETLILREDILTKVGRAREAMEDRRRIRNIRNGQLADVLPDRLAVGVLANTLFSEIQNREAACWAALNPSTMTATNGAELNLQADQSIYVTGPNREGVQYEIAANVDGPVTGLRLEAIPDPRLPYGGSGRATENGNFHVAEINVFAMDSAESENRREVAVGTCLGDAPDASVNQGVAKTIDGNRKTRWDTFPDHKQPHWAMFQFAEPVVPETDRLAILVRLDSGVSQWGPHGLGRFRLSFSGQANVVERARQLQDLKANRSDSLMFLGLAYAYLGENKKAATAFAAAVRNADHDAERLAIVAMASRFEEVASELSKQMPPDSRK